MEDKKNLRLDVQGLRAIAVLAVMIAHAGLPMPGGFIGVDIFFVISGFIITLTLIREEHNTGKISLTNFFIRRFRRLAPALAVMTATTLLLTLALLSPWTHWIPAAWVALAATFGVANYAVEKMSGGYFDPSAATVPFTHTWSLSVEEQFYLFFPFLLTGLFALRKRLPRSLATVTPLLVIGFLAGLSLLSIRGIPGLVASASFPAGYYGPLPRIWQFLAGVALAWVLPKLTLPKPWQGALAGLAGAGLLGLAFFVINEETPYPGKWAILPVTGAFLLLWAGTQPHNPISKLLSTRPLVTIGNWSYSLYLWHWPFVIFGSYLFPGNYWAAPIATAVSALPAVVSYRWVEQPFRTMRGRTLAARGGALVAFSVSMSVLVLSLHTAIWQPIISREAQRLDGNITPTQTCAWPGLTPFTDPMHCVQSHPERDPEIVVVGDSHTYALQGALATTYPNTAVAAMPMHASTFLDWPELAHEYSAALTKLRSAKVAIIINQVWKREKIRDNYTTWLIDTANQLERQGIRVVILDDQPYWHNDIFECAYRRSLLLPGQSCSMPRSAFMKYFNAITAAIEPAKTATKATIVSSFWATCDEKNCYRRDETGVLYSDNNHLSPQGGLRTHRYLLKNFPEYARLFQDFS